VPLQDVLGIDGEGRMNLPGRPGGNWRWRYLKDALSPDVRRRLRALSEASGRHYGLTEKDRVGGR